MLAAMTFLGNLDNKSDYISFISQNLLKINVYFGSKMTTLIQQSKTYDTVLSIFLSEIFLLSPFITDVWFEFPQ